MSVIAWIVLGLIAGFIGSKIVNRSGEGVLLDIVLGLSVPSSADTCSRLSAWPGSAA